MGAGSPISLADFTRKARRCGCSVRTLGGTHYQVTRMLASGQLGVYHVVAESGRRVGAVYVKSTLRRLEIDRREWDNA